MPSDTSSDDVNQPAHYTTAVPGVECIDVTQHFGFLRGNAIKYLWRADYKGNKRQDLEKAVWYIQRELDGLDEPVKVKPDPRKRWPTLPLPDGTVFWA